MDNQNNRLDNEESEDEAPETQELKDLSTILRSNVFPGSSHSTSDWCSKKSEYPDHHVSPSTGVGIYESPKKDYRRKIHQYSRWMEKDIETKTLTKAWNAYIDESRKKN